VKKRRPSQLALSNESTYVSLEIKEIHMPKVDEDHGWPSFQSRPTYYDDNVRRNKKTKNNTTSSMTFRVNSNTKEALQDAANDTGISLNTLVNQILTNYVKWDKFVSKAGMIPVAKRVISEAFMKLNEDEVKELATSVGKNALNDILLFMKGKTDLDSFLSWLELWLKKNSTAAFNYTVENDGFHTCIMKHDLGWKWSLYHKRVLELILSEILGKFSNTLHISITENMLVFKFKDEDNIITTSRG
jgi:antitoxin component of RelBE/YafQ-DinJ toxin-antitoxin module